MYMRQIMQAMVTLAVLMSSTATVSAMVANDSVSAKANNAAAEIVAARKITGVVYDAATKEPLPGVRVQGTGHSNVTTMTNSEGKYTLNIPSYVTLLNFSTPGYALVQRPVQDNDVIDVYIYTDKFSTKYNEDIVITATNNATIGYGPSLTVDGEIANNLGADVRAITRSGAPAIGAAMFIRGINSIKANTQPLVVVDGVIYDLQENTGAIHMGAYNNILSAIDINDIDDVRVLKNATALYGARAANGVLLITTKRGKSMATRITANLYGGVTLTPNLPDMMSAEQFRTYANEMVGTLTNTKMSKLPFLQSNPDYMYYNMYHNETDWSDYVYREAVTQNYKVNVEGGDEIAMYNFSLGYTNAESALESNDFNRLNIRFNSDIVLAKNFNTRFDIGYSRVQRSLLDDGAPIDYENAPISSIGFLSMIKAPFLSPYKFSRMGVKTNTIDDSDIFAYEALMLGGEGINAAGKSSYYNPLTILSKGRGENKNFQEYTQFTLSVAPEYTLGDFKISELFNYSLHRMSEKYYLPYGSDSNNTTYHFYVEGLGHKIGNSLASYFGKESSITSDTRLSWKKSFGAHNFDVIGGFRYTNFRIDGNFLSANNSSNDNSVNIKKDFPDLKVDGDNNQWKNMAWYLNADYNYLTRYFLQGTVSMETSSRFGKKAEGGVDLGGVKWGVFPSVQAAWLASSESWFNVPGINSLKLRAGFDAVGNDAIDYYAAQSYLQAVKYNSAQMGLELGNVENDGIKWETTERVNVGLDAILLNDRVALSFDAYKATTKDLIVNKTYKYVTGMGTYWSNGGEMENIGFEASINAKLVNSKNFTWELGASAGHYKNEITALDEEIKPTQVYGGEVVTKVGEAIGAFYGYKTDGVIASAAEAAEAGLYQVDATGKREYFKAGDMKFVDMTGEGEISDADKVIIGNPHPDLYGNIFSKFTYKNWQLDVLFNYSLGNDAYNYYRQQLEGGSNFFNQTKAMLNRWSYDGQQTNTPRLVYGDPMGNSRFSDRWIEDASYLRLKKIQLAYNLPLSLSWLQGITIWGAAENLFTFTNYLGSDPEFSVSNNVLYQGVDAGVLSQSRSFHLGVKINL